MVSPLPRNGPGEGRARENELLEEMGKRGKGKGSSVGFFPLPLPLFPILFKLKDVQA